MTLRDWFMLGLGALFGICLAGVLYAALSGYGGDSGDLVRQLDRIEARLETVGGAQIGGSVGDITVGARTPKRTLSTQDVADELGVNADTVRRRDAAGQLVNYLKVGRDMWCRVPE